MSGCNRHFVYTLAIVSTKHTELSNMANARQFTANVPLPSKLSTDSSSLAKMEKKIQRQFENYAIATRLSKEEGEFQCAVFFRLQLA